MQCTARAGWCAPPPRPPVRPLPHAPQPPVSPPADATRTAADSPRERYLPASRPIYTNAISVSGTRLELCDLTRIRQTALSCAERPITRTARVESADMNPRTRKVFFVFNEIGHWVRIWILRRIHSPVSCSNQNRLIFLSSVYESLMPPIRHVICILISGKICCNHFKAKYV